jgi:hypothetical protein
MKIIFGFIFLGMIAIVFLGWVVKLGRFGFMMIGMTLCVPAMMGCVLNLQGRERLWAIAPTVVFFVLVFLFYRDWSGVTKK